MSGTESGEEMEVGAILGERKNKQGIWYLVRWAGFGPKEDTWEKKSNLSNAAELIKQFYKMSKSGSKSKRKSTSRSRSRSRSKSRGRQRSRSSSSSSTKKSNPRRSSRSRKTDTTTTVATTNTPKSEETKTETITQSPGRFEKKTETITTSVTSPTETSRSSRYVTRTTTEVHRSTTSSSSSSGKPQTGWKCYMQGCQRQVQGCCQSLANTLRSDTTALVVFSIISIIMLSFVLEKHVDFPKLWQGIVAFFVGIWQWLASLVKAN